MAEHVEVDGDERVVQSKYWASVAAPNLNAMMLDTNAAKLDAVERPEILAFLPEGGLGTVVELGAGIGRFTGELAKRSSKLTAVDFVQVSLDANKAVNGDAAHVEFVCADVRDLQYAPESVDLIFSNWLLMYLSDKEVARLAQRALQWLRPGGHIMFRESCFHQSGDAARPSNPSHYRDPSEYDAVFRRVRVTAPGGITWCFRREWVRTVRAYEELKQNKNQIAWMWTKVDASTVPEQEESKSIVTRSEEMKKFLDGQQYTRDGILKYEHVFGAGFVSTGGKESTDILLPAMKLKPGQRVLDVGCGIGGPGFYMAEKFGVSYVGIDLSTNMIAIAQERAAGTSLPVEFYIQDVLTADYAEASFDVIYSRDALLHIAQKDVLFGLFFKWLKPGGQVFISDYARGPHKAAADRTEADDRFDAYVASRGYDLHTPADYGKLIERAGFIKVNSSDATYLFIHFLHVEMAKMEAHRVEFTSEFSVSDFEHLMDGWRSKITNVVAGCHKWVVAQAFKPTESEAVVQSEKMKKFLDGQQYTRAGILKYERIFGDGFISTGGKESTDILLPAMNLKPGQRVLDVGCGIGGPGFYMAEKFGVSFVGIDLSTNVIAIAKERAAGTSLPVEFHVQDVLTAEYPEASFDVIYSRDALLHISQKKKLFDLFFKWLKPGGQLFISDYARGAPKPLDVRTEVDDLFDEYVASRGYDLHTPQAYGELVAASGFVCVDSQDRTDLMVHFLQRELEIFQKQRASFIDEFSLEDYEHLIQGWTFKLGNCAANCHKWVVCQAFKPDA